MRKLKRKHLVLFLLVVTAIACAGILAACQKKHVHSLSPTAAVEATCTKDGNSAFWHCAECDKYFSDEAGKNEITLESTRIPALGHAYAEPEWTWNETSSAQAVFSCTRSGCEHRRTETDEAPASKEISPAGCEEEGAMLYTATVTFNGKQYTSEKEAAIPALSHKWSETPEWKWTWFGTATVRATFTCSVCQKTETLTTKEYTTEVVGELSCTVDGQQKHTAEISFNGKTYQNSYITYFEARPHPAEVVEHYEYLAPTCESDGHTEYWHCTRCGEYFSGYDLAHDGDEYLLDYNKTTLANTVLSKRGHLYGEPTWEWNGTSSAQAVFTCTRSGCAHTQKETAQITSKTIGGEIVYVATVTFNGKQYTDEKSENESAAA